MAVGSNKRGCRLEQPQPVVSSHPVQSTELGQPGRNYPAPASEWRWVLGYALALAALTSLPYLLGFLAADESWVFSGGLFGVEDVNSYLANMVSGSYGAWLFRTPYTAGPQTPSLFFLHYLWLGKLASPPDVHLQVAVLYHLFRVVSLVLVCLATYDLIAFFIPENSYRRWGLLLATLGGGAGWLILAFNLQSWLATLPFSDIPGLNLPLEFYSPETFGFLALFGIPHVALARAGLLLGIRLYLQAYEQVADGRFPWRKGLQAGLAWLLTLLAQPLTGMLSGVAAGLFLAAYGLKNLLAQARRKLPDWRMYSRTVLATLWIGIFPLPLVFYYFLVFQIDPVLRSWQLQSPLPSPHPVLYLFAYGLLLPFALLGTRRQIGVTLWLLPVGWVVAIPLLAYAPFNMQRRLVDGVWVALIVLAIAGVRPVGEDQQGANRTLPVLFNGAAVLSLLSTFLLLGGALAAARQPAEPVYLPVEQARVIQRLAERAVPGEVVLSAPASGNVLPTYAPVQVVIGIGTLTTDYAQVSDRVRELFSDAMPEQQRREQLQSWGVDYLFWGPAERELGDWEPGGEHFLQLLAREGEYALYRVRQPDID